MAVEESADGAAQRPIPIERALAHKMQNEICAGVAVVTVQRGRHPVGFWCRSVVSASVEPPHILICAPRPDRGSSPIRLGDGICVNILAADQSDLSAKFTSASAEAGLAGLRWHRGTNGAPVIDNAVATIEADVTCEQLVAQHLILVAHMTSVAAYEHREPLVVYRGAYGRFSQQLVFDG